MRSWSLPAREMSASERGRVAWPALLLVVVGVAVYANGIHGPFIYDDNSITVDRDIRELRPPWRVIGASADSAAAGRPVVHYSLAFNYALGRLDVRGYHLLNIAVHILSALTLFGVVRRTLLGGAAGGAARSRATGLAGATALIWMVHPLQSECAAASPRRGRTSQAFRL